MKKFLLAAICFLLIGNVTFAKSVQVVGTGITERAAIHNAMRQAIEQVLGARIDAKTFVRNHAVIEDEIFTNSEGYVSSFEVISKSRDGDLFAVEILAEVNDELVETHLLSRLQKKALIQTNADSPRIAVKAYDAAGQRYSEVEAEILSALQRQGFESAVESQADLLVLAEVKLTNGGVTLSSKLLSKTGKILYAGTQTGNVGMFTANAGATTLKLASRRAGQAVSFAALKSAANVGQHITLQITQQTFQQLGGNVISISKIKNLDGVNDIFVRRMNQSAELDIIFDGTAQDLAVLLERAGFKIISFEAGFVRI